MAGSTLFISEYTAIGWVGYSNTQLIHAPAAQALTAEQAITVGGSSTASAAFNAATTFIEIVADVDCAIAFGLTAPTADATKHYIPAKNTRYYAVNPGSFLAVISSS